MKRLSLSLILASVLASCGQYDAAPRVSLGISADDASSSVVVTKTVTPGDATNGAADTVTWMVGEAGTIEFNFSSRPGSQAAYLTGYKLTRDIVNNVDVTGTPAATSLKTDIYVPSGYACADREKFGNTRSCDLTGSSTVPANGLPPAPTHLDLVSGLVDRLKASNASVDRVSDVTFVGSSSTGQPIEITATHVVSRAIKAGDQ